MKRIIIQVDEAMLVDLDQAASEQEMSRSAFARFAIDLALAERERHKELDAIISSFTTRPQEDDLVAPRRTARAVWPT